MTRRRKQAGRAPRIGLFGIHGAGNLGNDGSFDAVFSAVRDRHPGATITAFCAGPDRVRDRYGIETRPINWFDHRHPTGSGVVKVLRKTAGLVVDTVRTARWVRRCDVVVVPGSGVLEATIPLRAWAFPLALLRLTASGRLLRRQVALVNVGCENIDQRLVRWTVTSAARLAHYRSYRDEHSKAALRAMGVENAGETVCPDLAFSLPLPAMSTAPGRADDKVVGIGVMDYHGDNGERRQADRLHATYVTGLKTFVRWLVDKGYDVRLMIGDHVDDVVVTALIDDIRATRPDTGVERVTAAPIGSLDDLANEMAGVGTVVATRYHNVVTALKLAKPTIVLSYARKSEVLMEDVGLGAYCQRAGQLDADLLVQQFMALQDVAGEVRQRISTHVGHHRAHVERQFDDLSALIHDACP